MTIDYDEAFREIKINGFFSEYLPPCFRLKEEMFNISISDKCDLIEPITFSMSRFDDNDSRRTIFVPELGAYSVLSDYFEEKELLKDINEFIENKSKSYSKIIMEDNTIMRHEQSYGILEDSNKINKSTYIDNVVSKIKLSAGSKTVLKLDISNCFSSIYTHFIPSIPLGIERSLYCYNNPNVNSSDYDIYLKYNSLDQKVRWLNKNQTNGLLVGPIFSKIIAEGLLTRIDIELSKKNLIFSRYVDDYEVYLNNENVDDVISIFSSILNKYGLHLNYAKTEVIEFPFYVVENFDRIINSYVNNDKSDYDLMELFNYFYKIEKDGTKGAIRYLAKNIDGGIIEYEDNDLLRSYILNIMSNNPRSLVNACSILIKNKNYVRKKSDKIKDILKINIDKEFDLEVIWLLYLLIKTDNLTTEDSELINEISNSNNELAITMLLCSDFDIEINEVKDKAKSWLLNYELYGNDKLDEDEFKNKLKLNKNFEFYKNMKDNKLHLCEL